MAKFRVFLPSSTEDELDLMLQAVPEGVAVVAMKDGIPEQTLLVFEDTGSICL